MRIHRAWRRLLSFLGAPLDLYAAMREQEEQAKATRRVLRRDRMTRDFAETLAIPPFWQRQGGQR